MQESQPQNWIDDKRCLDQEVVGWQLERQYPPTAQAEEIVRRYAQHPNRNRGYIKLSNLRLHMGSSGLVMHLCILTESNSSTPGCGKDLMEVDFDTNGIKTSPTERVLSTKGCFNKLKKDGRRVGSFTRQASRKLWKLGVQRALNWACSLGGSSFGTKKKFSWDARCCAGGVQLSNFDDSDSICQLFHRAASA
jgi:hypothetical protein